MSIETISHAPDGASATGLSWPLQVNLDDDGMRARLYPAPIRNGAGGQVEGNRYTLRPTGCSCAYASTNHDSMEAKTVDATNQSTRRLLLDSNIWVKEVGLMSRRASTLRLYMQERHVRLVAPEVVQVEATRHLADRMREHAEGARKAQNYLLRNFGKLTEWHIPSEEDIAERSRHLARGIDVPIDCIELQPDTALRGARRCAAQRAPAHRGRRDFADCLIWEEVLTVLDNHELYFITNDGGFFDGNGNATNLHPSLQLEAKTRTHTLHVERDLDALLKDFRAKFTIDTEVLLDFVKTRGAAITRTAETVGFEAEAPQVVTYKAFATEKAQEVEVRFVSVQPFADITEAARSTEGLRIEARGLYGTGTGMLEEISMDREELVYVEDGIRKAVSGSVAYGRGERGTIGSTRIASDRRDLIDSA